MPMENEHLSTRDEYATERHGESPPDERQTLACAHARHLRIEVARERGTNSETNM